MPSYRSIGAAVIWTAEFVSTRTVVLEVVTTLANMHGE